MNTIIPNNNVCKTIGKVFSFLNENPQDGIERLENFLTSGSKVLFSTEDVMEMTGWSRAHIIRLCKRGNLPHIPGNPHKFLYEPLMEGLRKLLVGGEYGRRKSKLKPHGSLARAKKDFVTK